MRYWAIQYSEGTELRASRDETKIRAAFNAIDPVLRERCRVVCLVEEEAAETLRPPAEDPFSDASFRATLETLRERDLSEDEWNHLPDSAKRTIFDLRRELQETSNRLDAARAAEASLRQRYNELLYAVLDPGFADKRTEEEAHARTLEHLRNERAENERRHNTRDMWASALEGVLTMSNKIDARTLSDLCALARAIRSGELR